jgi:hypothetical protein
MLSELIVTYNQTQMWTVYLPNTSLEIQEYISLLGSFMWKFGDNECSQN